MSEKRTPKTESKLEQILAAGHLAVTSECGPPRGSDPDVITTKAKMLKAISSLICRSYEVVLWPKRYNWQ